MAPQVLYLAVAGAGAVGRRPFRRELADRARRALGILSAEGLTFAEQGRGVFVRRQPPVRRASDRFDSRHRDQGKTAFNVEMEAAGRIFTVDVLDPVIRYGQRTMRVGPHHHHARN